MGYIGCFLAALLWKVQSRLNDSYRCIIQRYKKIYNCKHYYRSMPVLAAIWLNTYHRIHRLFASLAVFENQESTESSRSAPTLIVVSHKDTKTYMFPSSLAVFENQESTESRSSSTLIVVSNSKQSVLDSELLSLVEERNQGQALKRFSSILVFSSLQESLTENRTYHFWTCRYVN